MVGPSGALQITTTRTLKVPHAILRQVLLVVIHICLNHRNCLLSETLCTPNERAFTHYLPRLDSCCCEHTAEEAYAAPPSLHGCQTSIWNCGGTPVSNARKLFDRRCGLEPEGHERLAGFNLTRFCIQALTRASLPLGRGPRRAWRRAIQQVGFKLLISGAFGAAIVAASGVGLCQGALPERLLNTRNVTVARLCEG